MILADQVGWGGKARMIWRWMGELVVLFVEALAKGCKVCFISRSSGK